MAPARWTAAAAEYLFGGAGADLFTYSAPADSTVAAYDYVLDFEVGVDKLDFRPAALGVGATASIVQSGDSDRG